MVNRSIWNPVGTITSGRTILGPTQRSEAYVATIVQAEHAKITVRDEQGDTLEVRMSANGANNSVTTLELYASRGREDHYSHIGTVVVTQGAQLKSTGIYFIDTLDVTMQDESFLCAAVQKNNDQIARLILDTNGYREFLFISTALGQPTITVEAAQVRGQINSILPPRSLVTASDDGGSEVLTIATSAADNGADQNCRSAMVWTSGDGIHFKIGTTASDANDPILIPDQYFPVPVANTSLLRFFNTSPEAAVNIVWRN